MNKREWEILSTSARKSARNISASQQYRDLNAARDKRKRRRERNVKTLLAGGYKQVLFINS